VTGAFVSTVAFYCVSRWQDVLLLTFLLVLLTTNSFKISQIFSLADLQRIWPNLWWLPLNWLIKRKLRKVYKSGLSVMSHCNININYLLAPSKASWLPNWFGSPIISDDDIRDGCSPTDGGAKRPLRDGTPWNGLGTFVASRPGNGGRMAEK